MYISIHMVIIWMLKCKKVILPCCHHGNEGLRFQTVQEEKHKYWSIWETLSIFRRRTIGFDRRWIVKIKKERERQTDMMFRVLFISILLLWLELRRLWRRRFSVSVSHSFDIARVVTPLKFSTKAREKKRK